MINVPALPSIGFKLSIIGLGSSLDFLKYSRSSYAGLGRGKVLLTQWLVDADNSNAPLSIEISFTKA